MGMLTLTRREGESIVIEDRDSGEALQLVVLERDGAQVKLGISASRRFEIWREEVFWRRQRERRTSGRGAA